MRSLERIIAVLPWCSSICPSGTGVHCICTVHVSADLSLWLDCPMFWAPWYQSMSIYFQPSFFSSTLKRGGVWMCKLGVISQELLKIEVKLLLSANRKSYMLCRLHNNGWPWMTLSGIIRIAHYLCGSWASSYLLETVEATLLLFFPADLCVGFVCLSISSIINSYCPVMYSVGWRKLPVEHETPELEWIEKRERVELFFAISLAYFSLKVTGLFFFCFSVLCKLKNDQWPFSGQTQHLAHSVCLTSYNI